MSNREQSTYAQRLAAAIARDVERETPVAALRSLAEGCDAAARMARERAEAEGWTDADASDATKRLAAAKLDLAKSVRDAAIDERDLARGRLIAACDRARVTA